MESRQPLISSDHLVVAAGASAVKCIHGSPSGAPPWAEYRLSHHPWAQWMSVGIERLGRSIAFWRERASALALLDGGAGSRSVRLDGQRFQLLHSEHGQYQLPRPGQVGEYEQFWYEDDDAVLRFLRLDGGPWQVCTGMVLPAGLVRATA